MITAGIYPINVRRGDTGTWTFELRNIDYSTGFPVDTGPIDISAWDIIAFAKYDQNTVWFDFPIEKIDGGTTGRYQFYIDKSLSERLLPVGDFSNPDNSSYEVQVSFDNGGRTEVATILEGSFTVYRDLIRESDGSIPPITPPTP